MVYEVEVLAELVMVGSEVFSEVVAECHYHDRRLVESHQFPHVVCQIHQQ
jgi:hypothetical protein